MKIVMPCQYLAHMPGGIDVFLHMDMFSAIEKDLILQALINNRNNIFPTNSVWKRLEEQLVIGIDYSAVNDKDVLSCVTVGQFDNRKDVLPKQKKHDWRLYYMHNSDLNIFISNNQAGEKSGQDIYNFGFYSGYAQGRPELTDNTVCVDMRSSDSLFDVTKEIAILISELKPV